MGTSSQQQRHITIDAPIRARFKQCAPAALRRRTPARLRAHLINTLQWLTIGCIGLLGIYVWQWPPVSLLVVWLAGVATGIVSDLLIYAVARRRVVRQFNEFTDDQFVWYMVTAMQRDDKHVLDSAMQVYKPGVGLALDVGLGAIAAAVFGYWFRAKGIDVTALIAADPAMRNALLAVAAAPVIGLMSTLLALRSSSEAELDFHAGGRGFGLLAVVIAFLAFGESQDVAGKLMVFINGATVCIGLIAAFGVWLMGRERVWLEKHLSGKLNRSKAS